MALPAGIFKKGKDNSHKNYRAHEEWIKGKRLGRPKQVWVTFGHTTFLQGTGHWEKV